MRVFLEEPFIVNGTKSPIHCIDLSQPKTPSRHTPNYHYHDYIELLYALDADAQVFINHEKFLFKTGDMVIINSNDLHHLTFSAPSHYIVVKLSPDILYSTGNSLFELKYVLPFLHKNSYKRLFNKNELSNIDLTALFSEIMDEWNNQQAAYEFVIRSNILRIFSEIFRCWNRHNIAPIEAELNDTIKKALVYICENFDTVTEKTAAKSCGYSYNHFSIAFKKAVGKGFGEYILSLRLKEAEKKLVSSTDSIAEIAAFAGFSSSSHFISNFKKSRGITPHQFRKKYTNYAREEN